MCNSYSEKEEFKEWVDNCGLMAAFAKVETHYRSHMFNPEKTGSYGLLQIQCSTARMIGLKYSCEQLFDPKINMRFGMRYIIYLRKVHNISNPRELIAAWNAGSPIVCKDYNPGKCYPGEFINQEYVWKVYRHYKYLTERNHGRNIINHLSYDSNTNWSDYPVKIWRFNRFYNCRDGSPGSPSSVSSFSNWANHSF